MILDGESVKTRYRYCVERRPVWGDKCWGVWDRISDMWFDKGYTLQEARELVRLLNHLEDEYGL